MIDYSQKELSEMAKNLRTLLEKNEVPGAPIVLTTEYDYSQKGIIKRALQQINTRLNNKVVEKQTKVYPCEPQVISQDDFLQTQTQWIKVQIWDGQ